VALGTPLDEELLALHDVALARLREPDRAATAHDESGQGRRAETEGRAGHSQAVDPVPSAPMAASRVSWIVKTRSSPVISKIFVMLRSLHTSES
jgi:hypothetical protein